MRARFHPSLAATVLLLGLSVACLGLAGWQWQRAAEKAARQDSFAGAATLTQLPPAADAIEFTQLRLQGRFDTRKHLLADNQVLGGRGGVHVYTPFVESGGQTLLVNRGWLPLPAGRTPLPVVETPEEALTVKGRLGPMPTPGRQLGRALDPESNRWPQLVTYPSIERTGRALGLDLYPWVLFLDADSPGGFAGRDWRPVYMSPQKHQAYAFQWLTLAALALSCWVVTGVRRMETT